MAEVAVRISSGSDPAIAEPGKGSPPKKAFPAAGCFLGLRRICAELSSEDGVLTVG